MTRTASGRLLLLVLLTACCVVVSCCAGGSLNAICRGDAQAFLPLLVRWRMGGPVLGRGRPIDIAVFVLLAFGRMMGAMPLNVRPGRTTAISVVRRRHA